jgi:5-methylthioadenosine/S-adenosylhomocysteine deaminase
LQLIHALGVSIGTDGAPSNNRMTLIDDAWMANLIHKGRTLNPVVCSSRSVLEMITISAARCVLWDNEIGSLQIGKKADLVIINPNTPNMLPIHNAASNIITCMQSRNIESVMVNGTFVMRDNIIEGEQDILREAQIRAKDIVQRANIAGF